ncbi:MAG: response regulator [Planctomycetota bacterium]
MNALVLDDEQRYRDHVQRSLEHKGLRIRVAADAEEAQQIIRELAVDLMIVDIKLASRMDGLDFADWVRAHGQNPALIVITGYGSPEHERRCRDLGAVAYLEKPFDLRDLEAHVQRALDHRQLLREIHRLEQELASVKDRDFFHQTAAALPLVCIDRGGKVLYASTAGQIVLDAVVDPSLIRPIEKLDPTLTATLHQAPVGSSGWGKTTLHRRDGLVRHYMANVRTVNWDKREGFVILFQEGEDSGGPCDSLWIELLLKAAACINSPQSNDADNP